MEVYNQAHALARALQESDVYKKYSECKDKVEEDPQAKEMLGDYQDLIKNLQEEYMKGGEISEEESEKHDKMKDVILLNPLIKEFFEAEHRLGVVLMDIQKIISEAVI